MLLRASLLLSASIFLVHALTAQCVTSAYPNNSGGTIGVSSSGVSAADISAAIGMWGECDSYGSGFPTFESGGNGTWNVSVTAAAGRNPNTNGGCGNFSPTLNSAGAVIAGTIVVFELRGSDGGACGPTRVETIAHELGHFLGLENSTCSTYIMSGGNGQPGSRSVQPGECSRVDQQWETPDETPQNDGGDGDVEDCQSPLVLDLNGDGIHTTGIESTVAFDIDGNGTRDNVGWTNSSTEEGFLWLDLNRNHVVDGGHELFGIGMVMPDGRKAPDGFEALRVYDGSAFGGNADQEITRRDAIWERLRIWVDRNHDGVSQANEIGPIQAYGVVAIQLAFVVFDEVESNGNRRQFRSTYTRRTVHDRRSVLIDFAIEDVFFRVHQ